MSATTASTFAGVSERTATFAPSAANSLYRGTADAPAGAGYDCHFAFETIHIPGLSIMILMEKRRVKAAKCA